MDLDKRIDEILKSHNLDCWPEEHKVMRQIAKEVAQDCARTAWEADIDDAAAGWVHYQIVKKYDL